MLLDVLPDHFLVATGGGNIIASRPEVLSGEIPSFADVLPRYVNGAFALDECVESRYVSSRAFGGIGVLNFELLDILRRLTIYA